nr:urate hydroxylase PuuD [Gemmatimonadota bacterium]
MDAGTREILDLVFRWIHVVAGIMWIGNSLLFNWLDRNLLSPAADKEGIQGDIWLLHSGAFYYVEKDLKGWDRSRPLHWFKWQAYTTWLTGAVLLGVVYYASGGALLIDPAVANLSLTSAVALSVGVLAGGWLLYDLVISRLLAQIGGAGAAIGLVLVVLVAFGLTRAFSGRAAFLHVGALLGTLMAGNVLRVIMPSQRQLVAAVERGARPDPALARRAKERSIHNNYMTFPVVVLMLSSHFAGLYGHGLSWLL